MRPHPFLFGPVADFDDAGWCASAEVLLGASEATKRLVPKGVCTRVAESVLCTAGCMVLVGTFHSLSKYLRFPRAGPAYGETSSYFLKAPVINVI